MGQSNSGLISKLIRLSEWSHSKVPLYMYNDLSCRITYGFMLCYRLQIEIKVMVIAGVMGYKLEKTLLSRIFLVTYTCGKKCNYLMFIQPIRVKGQRSIFLTDFAQHELPRVKKFEPAPSEQGALTLLHVGGHGGQAPSKKIDL